MPLISRKQYTAMTILKLPSIPDQSPFFKDMVEDEFHIFSLKNTKKPDFYPKELPEYPGVKIKDLKKDDRVAIRIFFLSGTDDNLQTESELVEMEVVVVEDDDVVVEVMTELPDEAPLEKYDSLELYEEDILYKIN